MRTWREWRGRYNVDKRGPQRRGIDERARRARPAKGARAAAHGRYASLVFGLAARSLDHATAEEITQEIFLTVWQKAATFDPARGRSALGLAHHPYARDQRAATSRTAAERDVGCRWHQVGKPGRLGPRTPPARPYRASIAGAVVRAAVETLPAPRREALSLAFLEDLTNEQVADFLNLPLGTAKSRIRSGLKSLPVRLAPLVTAGLILAGFLTVAGLREQAHQAALRRQGRALSLVTNSDVVPGTWALRPGPTRRPTATTAACPASTWPSSPCPTCRRLPKDMNIGPGHLIKDGRPCSAGRRSTTADAASSSPRALNRRLRRISSRSRSSRSGIAPMAGPHRPGLRSSAGRLNNPPAQPRSSSRRRDRSRTGGPVYCVLGRRDPEEESEERRIFPQPRPCRVALN